MRLISRRLFLAAAAAAACLDPFEAGAQEALRVGIFPENKPWQFHSPEGMLVGFDIDLMNAIGNQIGRPLKFVPLPFLRLFDTVRDGQIDAAICSLTITAERAEIFDFTQAYYRTSQGIVVMRGAGIRSIRDLKGRRVSVVAGTTNEQWLSQNGPLHGFGPIVNAENIDEGLTQLEKHEADAYFGDLPSLLHQLLKRPDLAVIARLPTEDYYAVMLAKNSPLTARLDAAITALKKDDTLADIHRKWFGAPPEPGSPTVTPLAHP